MDAMNTTFNDEEFDAIRGAGILHHLDIELSLLELKRILKSDGIACFIEPLNTNPVIKLYRKLTPAARTIDEQPLRIKDIKLIKTIFPATEIYYFSFVALLAVPFRKLKCFEKILSCFAFIDKILLNKLGPLKWLA
jgi:ubiquinone/menaquinone biosynthesis C-methylase UbiE